MYCTGCLLLSERISEISWKIISCLLFAIIVSCLLFTIIICICRPLLPIEVLRLNHVKKRMPKCFQARSQNCEKRLLAASCPSARPRGTTQLPLEEFGLNLVFEHFLEVYCQRYVPAALSQQRTAVPIKVEARWAPEPV
jgi:hypothetical protein